MNTFLRTLIFFTISQVAMAMPSHTLRFLHLNVFGRDQKDCMERYKEIARRIHKASPKYDVITLNEHWDTVKFKGLACDGGMLTKLIESTGVYKNAQNKKRNITHLPRTESVDWLVAAQGGNSLFTRHEITEERTDAFVNSGRMPLMGSSLARIKVDSKLTLDMYFTHLEANVDGCLDEEDCRLEQLDSVANQISIFSTAYKGDHRSNPILLAGDFNIGGPRNNKEKEKYMKDPIKNKLPGNPGYEWIVDYFEDSFRDLWLEVNRWNLPYGYTYDCEFNNILDCKYQNRLDYFFVIEDKFVKSIATHAVKVKSMQMLNYWKTPKGLHVSDHFGLDLTLEFIPKE